MKRQPYFPEIVSQRPEWFGNFATQLPNANTTLEADAAIVAARVQDAKYCEYASGAWVTWVREHGNTATAALETLYRGTGAEDYILPVFVAPALPADVVPVPPGALQRIRDFVQTIKRMPTYTEDIGTQLRIIGEEDSSEHPVPEFTVIVERGSGGCECVKIRFKKHGHAGVVIFCRRGDGVWEQLAIDLSSPYLDERDLLVPGQPEMREYRLQWYDDDGANGPFTDITTVTVNP